MLFREEKAHYLILSLLCALLYFASLSSLPPIDRDEPHFAQASKQMLETNNYTQINFQNHPRHLKPPGIYWLQAIATKTLSKKPYNAIWTYRVPTALGAYISVLLLYGLSACLVGRKKAFMAAAVYSATPLLLVVGHAATTDAMQMIGMVAMQLGLGRLYLASDKRKKYNLRLSWFCFWGGMAFGLFIKGITPIIGLSSLVTLLVFDKQSNLRQNIKPLKGFSFLIILLLVWLIPFSIAGKSNFLWDMISGDVLPKLAKGGQQSHGAPMGYYILIFFVTFMPFSLLATSMWRYCVSHRSQRLIKFLIAWIIPNWVIYAFIATKLPEYILPLFPAFALLLILSLTEKFQKKRIWQLISLAIIILWLAIALTLSLAPSIVSYLLTKHITVIDITYLCVMLILFSLLLTQFKKRKPHQFIKTGILTNLVLFSLLFTVVAPSWKSLWLSNQIVDLITANNVTVTDEQPLYSSGYCEPSLIFLFGTHKLQCVSDKELQQLVKDKTATLLLVDQSAIDNIQTSSLRILDDTQGFKYNGGYYTKLFLVQRQG